MIRINKWRRSAFAWWITLALPACASTNMTSLRAPDVLADPYSRIMVYFPLEDLRLRQLVEDEFAEEDDRGHFLPSYSVLFPGREYTEPDIQDILIKNSVDDLPPRAVPHPMLVPAPVEGREGRASSGTRATA